MSFNFTEEEFKEAYYTMSYNELCSKFGLSKSKVQTIVKFLKLSKQKGRRPNVIQFL